MKVSKYARMSPEDVQSVVAELALWAEGKLGSDLTWAALEERFGFTRAAMDRKPEIKQAYRLAKEALINLPKTRQEVSLELATLEREVELLKKQVAEHQRREALWRERWQRIAFHIRLKGMHVHQIDRPAGGTLPDEQETAKILSMFDKDIPPARN
ncbi:protein kinase [Vreelandella rituensis]|uniref:Protein kinase n=1 Tax=Vreelandella rituensis TaxID=2282306 RepID=A0A368UA77_9GAMM|nr:protein kinase [Halomonas rituensis]RCV92033.1 protein kinase [Halomonas rituensis]